MRKNKKKRPANERRKGIRIEGIGPGGWGITGEGRNRVWVWGALLGDLVDIRVVRRLRGRVEAVVDRVEKREIPRGEAPCAHFDICGGCLWQHIDYGDQRHLKHEIVADCFAEFGVDRGLIKPVLGAVDIYAYRNKMDFSFGHDEGGTKLGMYISDAKVSGGRFAAKRGVVPELFQISDCKLQVDVANQIVREVAERIRLMDLPAYDTQTQQGTLRSLVIRHSVKTDQLLLQLLVAEDCRDVLAPLAVDIKASYSQVVGVVMSVNARRSKNAPPEQNVLLAGTGEIEESFADVIVNVSPGSFLQVNTSMAEHLYDVALELATLSGAERVLDLYCGTGALSLFLAKRAEQVVGVEVVASAVSDAEKNAVLNACDNTQFICGDVLEILPKFVEDGQRQDVITVNPPRAGIYRSVIKRICACKPKRIVYISCNPFTLARDLVRFEKGGYKTVSVQPVDMFPHTPHIESVALLTPVED